MMILPFHVIITIIIIEIIIFIIPALLLAVWIGMDAKKRGMSPWYATLPVLVSILGYIFGVLSWSPLITFFSIVGTFASYIFVGVFWVVYRSKHPLLKTKVAQPPKARAWAGYVCHNCQKSVQPDWVKCPYCKAPLMDGYVDVEKKVLAYVESHSGTISISQCSKDLSVSEENVRNTLKELEGKGKLKR